MPAIVVVALLAGCGGDDSPPSPPGSPEKPMVAKRPDPGAAHAREPGYQKVIEHPASKPGGRFSACSLVSRTQARSIMGQPIALPFEAPQGPTCIYRAAEGKDLVTVAVQNAEFGKLAKRVQQATEVKLGGRVGTCGQYGQPTLYLPVSGGRVLTIAAPCDVAKRFASHAVKRLDA
jgi:hypothetical protein